MTEDTQDPGSVFEVPERYLNINSIEIRPADITALVEKPLNFVSPANEKFRIVDLTHHDRWRPYRLSINKRPNVVLLNPAFATEKKAIDYLITILQRCISLVVVMDGDNKRFRIETQDGLITKSKRRSARLIEPSSFCDLLNAELSYDRARHRVITALLLSFNTKLQSFVENAVLSKFPKLEAALKPNSKSIPRNINLKKTLLPNEAPPRTVVTDALPRKSDDKS